MRRSFFLAALTGVLVAPAPHILFGQQTAEKTVRAGIAIVARIEMEVFEETKRARNEKLNELFREYLQQHGDGVTGERILWFNALLKEHNLTNFDDFLAAVTTPLRQVKDPATGEWVPVFGPLGSDLINPWLVAVEVVNGRPLNEQPMYSLASKVLLEKVDFALIGMKDPNLSLDLFPPKLRENGQWAYRRLNPTNQLDGGFDHPLFYATIRLAAMKLFREDHPQAKLTMADIVVSEEEGGFGLRSCLLCHNRNHTDVYKRLLGQSLYHEARAAHLRKNGRTYVDVAGNTRSEGADEAEKAEAEAAIYRRAAKTALDTFPDQINSRAARRALAMISGDNLSLLKPGYDEFCATLQKLGCLKCHSSDSDVPDELDPGKNGAYVLNPNGYYKAENIKELSKHIDVDDLSNSILLLKATAKLNHKGATEVKLDRAQAEELRLALANWVDSLRTPEP